MNNKITKGKAPSSVREKATGEKGAFESPPIADDYPPFSSHPLELQQLNKQTSLKKISSLFLFLRFSLVVKRPHLIYAAIDRQKEFQFIITTFANTLDKDIVTWEGRGSNHISHPGTMTILSEKLFRQISSLPGETLRRCKQSSWQQLIDL